MKTIILTSDHHCVYVGLTNMPLNNGDIILINTSPTSNPTKVSYTEIILEDDCRIVHLSESLKYIGVEPTASHNEWLDFMKGYRNADMSIATPETKGVTIGVGYPLFQFLNELRRVLTYNPHLTKLREYFEKVEEDMIMFSTTDIHSLRECVKHATGSGKEHYLYKRLSKLI